jgi:hypothetical protein
MIHQLVAICFLKHNPCGFDVVVDHIDSNKLNNNIFNLQLMSNRQNSIKDKNPKSGYSCIYYNNKKWLVRMRINNIKKSFGTFEKIEEAIEKRNFVLNNL